MNENITVDGFLEANQTNLLPVDTSYSGYEYEKVTSSTAPGSWTEGVRAEFSFPQYEDSVWDTESMYIDCVARLEILSDDGSARCFPMSYSTVAIEQMFTSGLIESSEVNYGGIDLQNIQGPTNVYPYLNGVYTLVNNKSNRTSGSARINNLVVYDGPDDFFTLREAISGNVFPFYRTKHTDVYEDAADPYNLSVDKSYQITPFVGPGRILHAAPFDCYRYGGTPAELVWNRSDLLSGYVYRQKYANSDEVVPVDPLTVPNGYKLRFLMKPKDGFLNSPYKKPANIPFKWSITRCRNLRWALCGHANHDARLAALADSAAQQAQTYQITFERMDLYCKRLFLTQNQISVYRSNPLLMYDVPRWSAQVFNLTSSTINQNTNWTKKPEALFAAIVPNASLQPTTTAVGTLFQKFESAFSSARKDILDFRSLYINTSIGQIPKHAYELFSQAGSGGRWSQEGVKRAYEDFKKACASPDDCISFSQWFDNMRIYGFIINTDQANPHTENSHPSRSTINVVAELTDSDPGVLSANSLVLIGMYYGRVGISDFKSVFLTT